jgi:pSer/pThr/pTyr-binding forkhead associated (FHA) protein
LSGHTQLATKSFAVELRVDGTLNKGEFRVQPVWDETESGHTMVTARSPDLLKTAAMPALGILDEGTDTAGQTGEGEATVVRPKITTLYSVELWNQGVRQAVVPIVKSEITIGRGSRSISVDLPLKGDPEISRVHALLNREADGSYWVTPKGRNPTLVSGREIPREERSRVQPDEKIEICSFTIRIQPQ